MRRWLAYNLGCGKLHTSCWPFSASPSQFVDGNLLQRYRLWIHKELENSNGLRILGGYGLAVIGPSYKRHGPVFKKISRIIDGLAFKLLIRLLVERKLQLIGPSLKTLPTLFNISFADLGELIMANTTDSIF